jgi:hypothetical protein
MFKSTINQVTNPNPVSSHLSHESIKFKEAVCKAVDRIHQAQNGVHCDAPPNNAVILAGCIRVLTAWSA